ncbi:MAG: glucosaminidase domain-containing protein [Candidatus Eisenbacteria bacterium]
MFSERAMSSFGRGLHGDLDPEYVRACVEWTEKIRRFPPKYAKKKKCYTRFDRADEEARKQSEANRETTATVTVNGRTKTECKRGSCHRLGGLDGVPVYRNPWAIGLAVVGAVAYANSRRSKGKGLLDLGVFKAGVEPVIREIAAAVRRVAVEFGFPPVPTDAYVTAHLILSSGWFDSTLDKPPHYNFSGVKAGSSWTGPVVLLPTVEYYTDAEIARAKAKPSGTRGSFKEMAPKAGSTVSGKKRVQIYDDFRSFGSPDAALRDYFTRLTSQSKYSESGEKLRTAAHDYMAQLGKDGWYTADTDVTQRAWRSIVDGSRLRGILGPEDERGKSTPDPVKAGVGVGVVGTVAAIVLALALGD